MSKIREASEKVAQIRLNIRRGSLLIPILTLIVSIVLFITFGLPSGNEQLGKELGITSTKEDPLTFEKILEKIDKNEDGIQERLHDRFIGKKETGSERHFGDYLNDAKTFGPPLAKIWLEQLISKDFPAIAENIFDTIWKLALYALIPGLAGLIYRRNFMAWFLAAFITLLAINASGKLGSLTTAEPMPGSGWLFFFLLLQIVILLLAYRLRRHSQGFNWVSPRIYNWGLTALLVFVGIACWMGWGPGYVRGDEEKSAASFSIRHILSIKPARAQQSPGDTGAVAEATSPAAEPDGSKPSWIWAFLGTGMLGLLYKGEFIAIGLPLIYTLFRNSSPWPVRKGKNIVICLDGTSNTPDQIERGFAAQTNVYKLFQMLKSNEKAYQPTGEFDASLCKRYGDKQAGFYYAGVGNKYDNNPILQVFGLAAGMGADEMVERAYLDLVRVYQPGDRVFITGFSRGAAIARLLARAIDARGAPRAVYTLFLFGKHRNLWMSKTKARIPISVLGCWDTVGAFGIGKTILGINFQEMNLGKDMTVPDNVQQAYHMLALDERRDSFDPTLMDPDPIRPERIVEIWFPGDHANIGGGWATDRLSDITLDFLLKHISSGYAANDGEQPGDETWGVFLAAKRGDKVDIALRTRSDEDGVFLVDPDPMGQVRQWFSKLYEYRPRTLPLHAVISENVFERMGSMKPAYAPEALFKLNKALDDKRDTVVAGMDKFAETQSLNQEERDKVLSANKSLRLLRWPDYWQDVKKKVARRLEESAIEGGGGGGDGDEVTTTVEDIVNPSRVLDNTVLAGATPN